jgi:hypothetical protein
VRLLHMGTSRVLEGVEGLVCVADKRQTHLCVLLRCNLLSLSTMHSTIVFLWDLVDGEIGNIDSRAELGLKRCTNLAELIPDDTAEERMLLDAGCAVMSTAVFPEAVICITEEARDMSAQEDIGMQYAYLRIMSSASRPKTSSSGKYKDSRQLTIFRYVSCVSSAQKGGQPTRHSNMIAPTDHQSHR